MAVSHHRLTICAPLALERPSAGSMASRGVRPYDEKKVYPGNGTMVYGIAIAACHPNMVLASISPMLSPMP